MMNGRTMNCNRARHLLSDRLNHSPAPLPVVQTAALDTHLHTCAACAHFDRRLRAGLAGVRALPSVPPNSRVLAEVERRIAAPRWAGLRDGVRRLRQGAGVVGAAMLLILVTGLTVLLLRPGEGTAPQASEAASVGTTADARGAVAGAQPVAPSTPPSPTVTPSPDTWAALRQRPLAVPSLTPGSPCPRAEGRRVSPGFAFALGAGPAYVTGFGADGVYAYQTFDNVPLGYREHFWLTRPDYQGPVLIRGRQLDGPNALQFGAGPGERAAELRLGGPAGTAGTTSSDAPGWRYWETFTIAPSPGCYAYQVDGAGFSETMIFQVVGKRPADLLPLPVAGSLPKQLGVTSGFALGEGRMRLTLTGAQHLVVRLDVGPTQATPSALDGPVVWQADRDPKHPRVAAWDDGRHQYQLTVLDGDATAWSENDLLALASAFANAR